MGKFNELVYNIHKPTFWKDRILPSVIGRVDTKIRWQIMPICTKLWYNSEIPECDIMEEDWDNLILLDACRFDQFCDINTVGGELEARISKGSTTSEFLINNFSDNVYEDTVYVTSSPMYRDVDLGVTFHDTIDVWLDHWDEENRTVPPDAMAQATYDAHKKYPNKRILSHFIQPHYPFIGERGDELPDHRGGEKGRKQILGEETDEKLPNIWNMLEDGRTSEEKVWDAYNENLSLVLDEVEDLLERFDEKTVVTSDHGNLVGERLHPLRPPRYGHPRGIYVDELRKVPWLIVEGDERKQITAEHASNGNLGNDQIATDRLKDLGYKM